MQFKNSLEIKFKVTRSKYFLLPLKLNTRYYNNFTIAGKLSETGFKPILKWRNGTFPSKYEPMIFYNIIFIFLLLIIYCKYSGW